MTHILRRPFLTDDPKNLNTPSTIFVTRLATPGPGMLELQGRPLGTPHAAVRTWAPSDYDIAQLFWAMIMGYRGIPFMQYSGDAWADLRKKIDSERKLIEQRRIK